PTTSTTTHPPTYLRPFHQSIGVCFGKHTLAHTHTPLSQPPPCFENSLRFEQAPIRIKSHRRRHSGTRRFVLVSKDHPQSEARKCQPRIVQNFLSCDWTRSSHCSAQR